MGSGASNRRYIMENADNLSVGPSARSIAARGMDGAIEEEREKERDERNNPGRYFIRCCGAQQSMHKVFINVARGHVERARARLSLSLSSLLSLLSSGLARALFRFLSRS